MNELTILVMNSEAALLNVKEITPHKTVFEWRLCNYAYYFDLGKRVYSPKLYPQLNGNRCQLLIHWIGTNKEHLGLYFRICKGRNDGMILRHFRMSISMQSINKNGMRKDHTILPTAIDANRELAFTIHPGKDASEGWGSNTFLSSPDLQNYIIDDSLTVICTMTPA